MVAPHGRASPWVGGERRRIVAQLRSHAGSPGTDTLRAYLGSPVPVLGVRVPDLRRVVREEAVRLRARPVADAHELVHGLWGGEWFEERLMAIELLGRPPLKTDPRTWGIAARWVDTATGWALSDSLASGPVAAQVTDRPERFADLLRWTESNSTWRRRASTYALRGWFRAGLLDRPLELLERLLDDPERWVQRAVGTWLRECWKQDRARTERFLRRQVRRLAPITITVATERAPKRFREELRRASARGRAWPRGL